MFQNIYMKRQLLSHAWFQQNDGATEVKYTYVNHVCCRFSSLNLFNNKKKHFLNKIGVPSTPPTFIQRQPERTKTAELKLKETGLSFK